MLSGGMARGCISDQGDGAREGLQVFVSAAPCVCSADGGGARRAYLFAGAGGTDVDVRGAAHAMHTRVL